MLVFHRCLHISSCEIMSCGLSSVFSYFFLWDHVLWQIWSLRDQFCLLPVSSYFFLWDHVLLVFHRCLHISSCEIMFCDRYGLCVISLYSSFQIALYILSISMLSLQYRYLQWILDFSFSIFPVMCTHRGLSFVTLMIFLHGWVHISSCEIVSCDISSCNPELGTPGYLVLM